MADTTTTVTITAGVSAVVALAVNLISRVFSSGQHNGSVKQRLTSIETAILAMQTDFKELTKVLVDLASLRVEINGISGRMNRIDDDIRELRHGEGFVLPIRPVPDKKP